jgi:DNA-binding GntR family transcriptional regulator
MEDDELLSSIRQIVREELRRATEHFDARFDQLDARFHAASARLDRTDSSTASTTPE